MRRLTFEEAMELAPLPPAVPGAPLRFMSRRAAWLPGSELGDEIRRATRNAPPGTVISPHTAAFGGHVYAQSVKAVCAVIADEAAARRRDPTGTSTTTRPIADNLGLHTIHGYFTAVGRPDRPYVYEVAIVTRGRSFVTARVDARQPRRPSVVARGGRGLEPGTAIDPDVRFPVEDVYAGGSAAAATASASASAAAADLDLGVVCFTALVSFAAPRPHSLGADCQEAPPQTRFAGLLARRAPARWDPAPPVDIEVLLAILERRDVVGAFPMVDMKKVDMTAYNAGRPLPERRELILYRLLAPLDARSRSITGRGSDSIDAVDPATASILIHAYAADRNGLLMAANHLEFPLNDKVATLSNTFVVHTNAAAARMAYYSDADSDGRLDRWWLQEFLFSRAGAGRAIVHNKIWSPAGVHVATEYQDGLCTAVVPSGRQLDGKL